MDDKWRPHNSSQSVNRVAAGFLDTVVFYKIFAILPFAPSSSSFFLNFFSSFNKWRRPTSPPPVSFGDNQNVFVQKAGGGLGSTPFFFGVENNILKKLGRTEQMVISRTFCKKGLYLKMV